MQLDQVKAVVTGGVSGLGHAVAAHLVAHGGKVALFDVNDDKGAAAVAALGADKARYFRTDVSDEAAVTAHVAAAREFLGGLNVAVNCAGILGAGRVLGKEGPMPLKNFATTVMVNLVGSFNVAKAAAALMQDNSPGEDGERGVIVNTSSGAAWQGQVGQAAYSASKAGVIGLTLPVARDLADVGVRVVTIAPGLFDTGMVANLPENVTRSIIDRMVLFPDRLGHPDEFAGLVQLIVETAYFNATTINLDAGARLTPR